MSSDVGLAILQYHWGSRNSAANPSRRQPRSDGYLAVARLVSQKEFTLEQVDLNRRTRVGLHVPERSPEEPGYFEIGIR